MALLQPPNNKNQTAPKAIKWDPMDPGIARLPSPTTFSTLAWPARLTVSLTAFTRPLSWP